MSKMENRVYREMLRHPEAFAPMQIEAAMDAIDEEPDVARAWEAFTASHPQLQLEAEAAPFRSLGEVSDTRQQKATGSRHQKTSGDQQTKVEEGSRLRKMTAVGWYRKVAATITAFVVCGLIYTVAIARGFLPNIFAPSEKISEDDNHQAVKAETVIDAKAMTVPNEDESILYDNVPLSQILEDIAAYHNLKVTYLNEQTGTARLFYKWLKEATLEETIRSLNSFERITIEQKDSVIVVM